MTIAVPYSFAAALVFSGFMQRAAARRFEEADAVRESHFSKYSSNICFFLAICALAASIFMS